MYYSTSFNSNLCVTICETNKKGANVNWYQVLEKNTDGNDINNVI